MALVEKLKELRMKVDLSQRKVASVRDVDIATYCKFEKGILRINRNQILKYSKSLNIDIKEMLAIWLANQMPKTVSEESKGIVKETIKNVCKSVN